MNEFDDLTREFFLDARDRLARAEELFLSLEDATEPPVRAALLADLKRELHTIKGNSGMMGFTPLQTRAHHLEDAVFALAEGGDWILEPIIDGVDDLRKLLEEQERAVEEGGSAGDAPAASPAAAAWQEAVASSSVPAGGAPAFPAGATADEGAPRGADTPAAPAQASVRVSFQSLDELVELLAEMVIFRNRLSDAISRAQATHAADRDIDEIGLSHEALAKTLGGIQDRVMRLRMVPLRSLFGSLRRIVHDEGRREGKEVRFEIRGGETPIDKALLEVAAEALGHLVRNAVIHGLESPDERRRAGKPPVGTLRLVASSRTEDLQLEITDDGRGVDRGAVLASARRSGIEFPESASLETILFRAGVSTRRTADIGSGRGVGLRAVQLAVERVGGRVQVASEAGRGTNFRIRLPLTVSILRTLLVVAGGETYALPLANVLESLRFGEADGREVNHALVYRWRGEVLPLLDIASTFGQEFVRRRSGYVMVIESDGKRRGLLADEITGIREIVVKGLDAVVGTPAGISGSTILGDGRVILILDPRGLVALSPFVGAEGDPVRPPEPPESTVPVPGLETP